MEKLNRLGQTEKEFLANYNPNKYEKPSVTVDTLIFTVDKKEVKNYRKLPENELKILLIQRGDHPYIDKWAIPGGFVNMNESVDQAAERELFEETGVKDVYLEQLYTWDDAQNNPNRRDPRMKVTSISYMALTDINTLNVVAGDDASDAKWFSINKEILGKRKEIFENGYKIITNVKIKCIHEDIVLESELEEIKEVQNKKVKIYTNIITSDFAFDHSKIISYALDRLSNKVDYTDIIFNLMPENFSISELGKVYAILTNIKLTATQLERKFMHKLEEVGYANTNGGHRPPKLFKYNIHWDE